MIKKYIFSIILLLISSVSGISAIWRSHLAYNNVTNIAISPTKVFALSAGSLYSVDIIKERMTLYDTGLGLHSTNIHNIGYDSVTKQLLIVYETGKMDIINEEGEVQYISDFYDKDITSTKTTNNITFHNGIVYMSEPFGVLTFSMTNLTFMQCCYIGEEASEVNVEDIVVYKDSLYAFAKNSLFVAHIKGNLLDYREWHKGPDNGRVQRNLKKNTEGVDACGDTWKAGGDKGVLRHTITGADISYLPDGPYNNTMYEMACFGNKLYVVNGGAWASQYKRPGCIMILQDNKWHNVTDEQVKKQIADDPFLDCMNVVQDPQDANHYFVTTYGTGLFEMQGDKVLNHFMSDNSTLTTAAPLYPKNYTRCVGAQIDSKGTLWAVVGGENGPPLVYKKRDGEWGSIYPIVNGTIYNCSCPLTLLIDQQRENYKWIATFRSDPGILLVDDHGTIEDESDDRAIFRKTWQNQYDNFITPPSILTMIQDADGNIWFGGENTGLLYIPKDVDFFNSDQCQQIMTTNENGKVIGMEETINDIAQDKDGNMWVATNAGIYVLQADGAIVNHFTVSNTILSTNNILSLAYCEPLDCMYIGSSDGLFSYNNHSTGEDNTGASYSQDYDDEMSKSRHWTNFFSFGKLSKVEDAGNLVYGVADGAICSVDKTTEDIITYSKINGLNGSLVKHIAYDKQTHQLMIIYNDNMIDLLDSNGDAYLMSDLFLKSSSLSLQVNAVRMANGKAYLGLSFGAMSIDMKKREIENTYYIGANASSVNVTSLALKGDTLFAASADTLYYVLTKSNMMDYAQWKRMPIPRTDTIIQQIVDHNHSLYIRQGNRVYRHDKSNWKLLNDTLSFTWIRSTNGRLLGFAKGKGVVMLKNDEWTTICSKYTAADAIYDSQSQAYWLAVNSYGIIRFKSGNYQKYLPSGPYSNYIFRLQTFGDMVMIAPGGRWASQENRYGDAIWMDASNRSWHVITRYSTNSQMGVDVRDILYYAVDPHNTDHFYAASYGRGVIEYQGGKAIMNYSLDNSTLRSAIEPTLSNAYKYVRTDGVYLDKNRNLWVVNTGGFTCPLHVMSPDGHWYPLPLKIDGTQLELTTPSYIIQDNQHPERKWILEQRGGLGVILFDDGGTPYQSNDDRTIKRHIFIDQNGKAIIPEVLYSFAQDHNGDVWVGYEEGIFIIPAVTDVFTTDQCKRVIIPRKDGTGLADYLLGTEQVQCIAVDGANRKWIGTASSGVYLVSEDGLEELAHFTAENSPLLSNEITSIAILDKTGEVFIGTGKGLISYRGDASQPREDYSDTYAYPNPVRPDYFGPITICGLMDNSIVNIIDAGGNLVCKTYANGGTAIWDGYDQRGHRAAAGVYTVLCNTADGQNHQIVKILIL